MLSSSWVRSQRSAMKVRPRKSNWAGLHGSEHHATRQSSPSTKVSRPSICVGSTAYWSPAAWTDSYACGTHISLGEEPGIWWSSWRKIKHYILKKHLLSVVFFLSGNQPVFWKAILLPSSPSTSCQRTVRSCLSPQTAQLKYLFCFILSLNDPKKPSILTSASITAVDLSSAVVESNPLNSHSNVDYSHKHIITQQFKKCLRNALNY